MNVTKQPETLGLPTCSHVAVPRTRTPSPATTFAYAIVVLMLGLAVAVVIAATQGRVNVDGQFDITVNLGSALGTQQGPPVSQFSVGLLAPTVKAAFLRGKGPTSRDGNPGTST